LFLQYVPGIRIQIIRLGARARLAKDWKEDERKSVSPEASCSGPGGLYDANAV